jgi:hypothetical protein
MFRFSIDRIAARDANQGQLVSACITLDEDFSQRMTEAGEDRAYELFYRVENRIPKTPVEAVEFVQGVFFHPPERVWIGDEEYEVTDEDVATIRKPGA